MRDDGPRRHEELATPTSATPGAPQQYRFLVLRTEHGIVQLRTTIDGEPVAIVTQRSTYGRELDSAVGFERLGNPDYVRDAQAFRDATAAIDSTCSPGSRSGWTTTRVTASARRGRASPGTATW